MSINNPCFYSVVGQRLVIQVCLLSCHPNETALTLPTEGEVDLQKINNPLVASHFFAESLQQFHFEMPKASLSVRQIMRQHLASPTLRQLQNLCKYWVCL